MTEGRRPPRRIAPDLARAHLDLLLARLVRTANESVLPPPEGEREVLAVWDRPEATYVLLRVSGDGHKRLTPRETEVLRLVGAGLSNPDIASELGVRQGTIQSHLRRICSKLGVRGRPELAVRALMLG